MLVEQALQKCNLAFCRDIPELCHPATFPVTHEFMKVLSARGSLCKQERWQGRKCLNMLMYINLKDYVLQLFNGK